MVGHSTKTGGIQWENAQLRKEKIELEGEVNQLRQSLCALSTLQELTNSIDIHTDIRGLLQRVMMLSLDVIGAGAGSLLLMDGETGELGFVVVIGGGSENLVGHRLPKNAGIAGWVAQHGKPIIVPNVRQDHRFLGSIDDLFQFQTRSMLCVPITHDYKTMGIIEILNKNDGREFDQENLNLMCIVGQVVGSVIVGMERALIAQTKKHAG